MSRKTFSILFFTKKSKLNKQGEAPIYMRITIDGERSETSLKRTIPLNQWDSSKGKAKTSHKYYKDLNQYLDHTRNQVFLHQQELERKNRVISARTLMNRYLNKDDDDKRTILRVHEEHNKKMYLLIGKGVAFNTYKRYETSKDHLERFIDKEFGQTDYYLKDINPEFLDKYESYFRVDRECNNNTTAKYIKNFAKIIRWAMKNEWISNNPLKNLKLKYEVVDKEYLTDEELTIIKEKSIKVERIEMVRDIFVFCCYTGLAYVDAHALKFGDIQSGPDGTMWLKIRRKKTGQAAHIPLLPPAIEIIEKYKNHPVCIRKGVILPVLSNQKMNAYLKEIADLSGIKKNLTTHSARHTFATTVTLANNISMESVSILTRINTAAIQG